MRKKKRTLRKYSNANFKLRYDLKPSLEHEISKWHPSSKKDYLLTQFASKFVSSDTAPAKVRRTAAIRKWLATEKNNEATNVRLLTVDPGYNILPRVTFESFVQTVQRFTLDILGSEVPNENIFNGMFSGGASTSRPRTRSHPGDKYTGKADITQSCLHLVDDLLEDRYLWDAIGNPVIEVVEGNVLFTVPKTTDIDRCACKEPDINMYFQKGVGEYLRTRLRKFGVNLNDQLQNQALARLGSIDGSLATIDLSAASDSVSTELVRLCLPSLWFYVLDWMRSKNTIIDGELHVNEMFSSMGNGFTFELESMLFYVIARSVAYHTGTPGVISVYGDDIIVPSSMCQDLIFVLSFLGFETNKDKTFFEGEFRESCGGHYIRGDDVTPFYIRRPVDNLHDAINLANQLRRWAIVGDGLPILDDDVWEAWKLLATQVPKCFWGGYDTGDSSRLVSDFQPNKPMRLTPILGKRRNDIGTYIYWHDLKEHFPESILDVSQIPVDTGVYRTRPVRGECRRTEHIFLAELYSEEPPQ